MLMVNTWYTFWINLNFVSSNYELNLNMSAIVKPIALLNLFKIEFKASTCHTNKAVVIIIDMVLLASRKYNTNERGGSLVPKLMAP